MIFLLWSVVSWTFVTWQLCAVARSIFSVRTGILNTIRAELHPFRWVLCVGGYILQPLALSHPVNWWQHGTFMLAMWMCWNARCDNDDDDRWRRRKGAITSRIAEVAGRLVIAPTTSS